MVGVLPKTTILLTYHDRVVGQFSNKTEVAHYLGVSVDVGSGILYLQSEPQNPYYIMGGSNGFSGEEEVIKDWANRYLKLPCGYKIYRVM